MDYFQSIEIRETDDQLTIILHVDHETAREHWVGCEDPMTEFAAEFLSHAGDRLDAIREKVFGYLNRSTPPEPSDQEIPAGQTDWLKQAKRAMVVVMLGTTVLTSFPLPPEALAAPVPSQVAFASKVAATVPAGVHTVQLMSVTGLADAPAQIAKTIPYTVSAGDSLWKIATNYRVTIDAVKQANGLTGDLIIPGQLLNIPLPFSATLAPVIINQKYTVAKGDTVWTISVKAGIPMSELLKVNGLTMNSVLTPGQTLTIPAHYIPVRPVAAAGAGEFLDWWTEAQYVLPIGKTAQLTDVKTGLSWNVKRTIGAFHSDTEPATAADAAVMKKVWGGNYSWATRAVIVKVDGRSIAASASSMPHGVEYIANNDFTGHFDLHFKNSTRHKDGLVDPLHQAQVRIAAGLLAL